MSQRIRFSLQPAFILHSRPYLNTSCLLYVLTRDYGKLTVVVRGGRRPSYRCKSALQLFIPIYISCQGSGSLLTVTHVESHYSLNKIHGNNLFSGLYLNELLYLLLPDSDQSHRLFTAYTETILGIANNVAIEPLLRTFERIFLEELGYGLDFNKEAHNNSPIKETSVYRFEPMAGFMACSETTKSMDCISGSILQAIAKDNYQDPAVLHAAKWIMRKKIKYLLADKPLNTRRYVESYTKVHDRQAEI